MTEHPVSLRVSSETLQLIDKLSEALVKQAVGLRIKRGAVLRLALERGIEELLREVTSRVLRDEAGADGIRYFDVQADSKEQAIAVAKVAHSTTRKKKPKR